MGNGPGGLLEYIALMRSEPLFQGGLVWEWANHGLLTEKNGTEFYGYGGDFGDEPNDGVFIMDGLMLSDHSPMPSIFEYAKVIQPVTVNATSDGSKVVVINHYDFSDLSALDVSWHIVQDGETTEPQPLKLPDVPPRENRTIDWPIDIGGLSQEAWLIVEFRLKEDKPWADKGHVVAWDQVYIAPTQAAKRSIEAMSQGISLLPRQNGLNVTQDGARLHVQNGDSLFGFDLVQGNVTWTVNGVDLFQRGPELYFYRALTSNDMGGGGDSGDWSDKRIGEMHTQLRDIFWQGTDEGVTVRLRVRVAPKVLAWAAEADLVYTITAGESQLKVQVDGDFTGINVPEVVPRIGLMAVMPAEFNSVTWFGRGPGENYKDSKQACRMGRYESNVDDLFTYYDYPQENGNREDLRWLQIGGPEGVTLDARMNQPFSFTASRFMPHDLNNAPHPHDLRPLDMTVLHLDYDNNGLGSASVGPRPFDQYRCWTDPFSFTFDLSLV
jgi:beta-galactosidase